MPGIGIAISPHFKNNNFSFARYWANLINDGNTLIWYDSSDLTTIDVDGSNILTAWRDKMASGRNLLPISGKPQPTLVDGAVDFYYGGTASVLKTATFTSVARPYICYCLVKEKTRQYSNLFDGGTNNQLFLTEGGSAMRAGNSNSFGSQPSPIADSWFIAIIQYNGDGTSYLKIDDRDAVYGNCGTSWMSAITLNKYGTLDTYSRTVWKQMIWRSGVETEANRNIVYDYLVKKKMSETTPYYSFNALLTEDGGNYISTEINDNHIITLK